MPTLLLLAVEQDRFLLLLFPAGFRLARAQYRRGVDVVQVEGGVALADSLVLVGHSTICGVAIVVPEDSVILASCLYLTLLLDGQIVLVVQLSWQAAELVRRLQTRRHQIQVIHIIL